MLLEDYFDIDYEIQWGSSVSYILKKSIPMEVVVDRFGTDSSWFNRRVQNEMLLKKLETQMLYDENKWIIMQVLGVYHSMMSDRPRAQMITRQLCDRFPQFEIPDEVRHLTGV